MSPPVTDVEALSMTATPHLSNGVSDGTEAVSGVQTLSRTLTNAAGPYVEEDGHSNLGGLTYSTVAHQIAPRLRSSGPCCFRRIIERSLNSKMRSDRRTP